MLLVILYFMAKNNNLGTALPMISLYAFAGYRLMPALQKIYVSLTQIRFVGPALDDLYNELKYLKLFNLNQSQGALKFNKVIT